MPPYRYETPSYAIPSILDLIERRGDIAAQRSSALAAIGARSAEANAGIWGGAIQNIGQTIAQLPQTMAQQQRQGVTDQINTLRLKDAQRQVAGEQATAGLMRGDQLPTGDTGPRQETFLGSDGLFDVGKITHALGQMGFGDRASELVSGAEKINDSILKHQQLEKQAADQHTILIGDLADGALKMAKAGTPLVDAMDFVVQPALARKRVDQQEYQQIRDQIAQLPPERQAAALTALRDQAERIAPTRTLAEGAIETGRYGTTLASGEKKPKNEAEIALDAATVGTPQETPTAKQSAATMALLKPKTPAKRTEAEQDLDAYAQSIGKPNAEALTDADRQAYRKRDADAKAKAAFAQHANEHAYDLAHPAPVKGKSQDELEQEARGVLQREFSSRSGGLGTEDAKVNQAIHLLTLMNQYEGKPMPAQIHGELALGLARLTSPNGQVGIELEREFKQKTLAEGASKAIAYLTGDPTLVDATPEKLREMLRDSITRQGHVAEENRQTYLNSMLSMLPTQLESSRRDQISKSVNLNRIDTVQMRAPNGQVQDVPRNQIEHYKALGAKVIGG